MRGFLKQFLGYMYIHAYKKKAALARVYLSSLHKIAVTTTTTTTFPRIILYIHVRASARERRILQRALMNVLNSSLPEERCAEGTYIYTREFRNNSDDSSSAKDGVSRRERERRGGKPGRWTSGRVREREKGLCW